ncbi:hypothetical protein KSI01_27600 [Kurthia sibirica]|nr:hypothetical protein KSI01_27600 [Kurthia sibirica]
MITAVTKARNKHEETVCADHYGFEPQTCNPYSGHEKGNAENKVGYIRYNFITPAPVIKDLKYHTHLLQQKHTKNRK